MYFISIFLFSLILAYGTLRVVHDYVRMPWITRTIQHALSAKEVDFDQFHRILSFNEYPQRLILFSVIFFAFGFSLVFLAYVQAEAPIEAQISILVLFLAGFYDIYFYFFQSIIFCKDGIKIVHLHGSKFIASKDVRSNPTLSDGSGSLPGFGNVADFIVLKTPHKKFRMRTRGKADVILAHIEATKDQ